MLFPTNPCQTCGACCTNFRVSFYWREADPESGGKVPPEMVQKVDDFRSCMKGTDQKNPRCIALEGEMGRAVNCTIYENRPTPCREFAVDWKDGMLIFNPEDLRRCTQARARFGLPPLLDQPPTEQPETPTPHEPDFPERKVG